MRLDAQRLLYGCDIQRLHNSVVTILLHMDADVHGFIETFSRNKKQAPYIR